MTVDALIIESDPQARQLLRETLELEIAGLEVRECATGGEAAGLARGRTPALVMLDLELPDIGGFQLLRYLAPWSEPLLVLLGSDAESALKAFDLGAVDYLVKPIDPARLRKAATRLKARLAALFEPGGAGRRSAPLVLKAVEGGLVLIDPHEIDWLDAAGRHSRLNAQGRAYLVRETISALQRRLDPSRFVRVHRSTIVNVRRVREVRPQRTGNHLLVLSSGERFNLSRSRHSEFNERLGLAP